MLFFNLIDEESIIDRKPTPIRVILSLASILTIFALCNYGFTLHWAIAFSICITYTTSFDRALQNVFGTGYYEKSEQAD